MKHKRWDATILVVCAVGLALACETRTPTAASSAWRGGDLSASAAARGAATEIRWDFLVFTSEGIESGGSASATGADGLKIIVSGSGTFVAPAGNVGTSSAATGGGEWETQNASGDVTGSGTFQVTGLVSWERALASLPPGAPDRIADPATSTAGLAILRVAYSDGTRGTLTISCRITGVEPGRFEGITATKGFVDFWSTVPSPNLFHILR